MAWHGLTSIKEDLEIGNCWLRQWDISPEELVFVDGTKSGFHAFRSSDNSKLIIGKPQNLSTFTPITNGQFLDIIQESAKGQRFTLQSCGSVCSRGRVFASFSIDGLAEFQAAGRKFEAYLNFLNAHDGSCVFVANTSNVCTVCNNTFSANLHSRGGAVNLKVKHSKFAQARLENLPEVINAAIGVQKEFALAMEQAAQEPLNSDKAKRLFSGFLGEPNKALSTRTENTVNRLTELFSTRNVGNAGENLSDAFSAVTDFYSHESAGGDNRWKQFVSSEFGAGQNRKAEFFSEIWHTESQSIRRDNIQALVNRGDKVLVETLKANKA